MTRLHGPIALFFAILIGVLFFILIKRGEGFLSFDECGYVATGQHCLRLASQEGAAPYPIRFYAALLKVVPKPPLYHGFIAGVLGTFGVDAPTHSLALGLALFVAITLTIIMSVAHSLFGPGAAWGAAIAYLGSAFTLEAAMRPSVEGLQGLTILGSIVALSCVQERRPIRSGIFVGVFIGFGLLTKTSTALFLFLPVILSLVSILRLGGFRKLIFLSVGIGIGAIAIAGPWYAVNFAEALEYARKAPGWPVHLGAATFTFWNRILLIFLVMSPASLLFFSLLSPKVRSSLAASTPSTSGLRFLGLTLAASVFSILFFLLPAHFEPKWLLPIIPASNVALGAVIAHAFRGRVLIRILASGPVLLALAVSCLVVSESERFPTDWSSVASLQRLSQTSERPTVIGIVWDMPALNKEKLIMFNEFTKDPNAQTITGMPPWTMSYPDMATFDYVIVSNVDPVWREKLPLFDRVYSEQEELIRSHPDRFVEIGSFGERGLGRLFRVVKD